MTSSGLGIDLQPDGAIQISAQSGFSAAGYLQTRFSQAACIASRATPASQGLSTAGTITGANTKASHISPQPLVEIRLAFGNYYNNGGAETDGVNDITVRASIEYPATVFIPIYFQGKRDVVINPGGTVWSDWVSVSVPAATAFWSRTYVTIASNALRFPLAGNYSAALLEGSTNSAGETDKTTTGTLTGGGFGYGPYGLQAMPLLRGSLRVVGVGDSRITGNGDTDTMNGWFGRLFDGVTYANRIAWPTEKAQQFAANITSVRRKFLLDGSNVAICGYGINDLTAGRTLAQLQADNITIWQYLAQRGIAVFQATIEPSTTSSDNWATVANQTFATGNTPRINYNNWLRDGSPIVSAANPTAIAVGATGLRAGQAGHPLSGYIELADSVESARDSGKWAATGVAFGYTTDGLHQSPAAHAIQARVVNVSALTNAGIVLG